MKWLGRILWLLFGLLWRLVVLLLFEKWVPFPEGVGAPQVAPQPSREGRRKRKQRAREEAERAGAARPKRPQAPPPPFFAARSSELSPEQAAQREGEHWVKARRGALPVPVRTKREGLGGLLRDRRALRDAVVLGAALGPRSKS